jgi:succinate dehydrogenase/fumarate reductase flavoprotein subunit
VDLVNMLLVSRLLASSALAREESRGTHFRRDFDQRNDGDWQCHTMLSRGTSS